MSCTIKNGVETHVIVDTTKDRVVCHCGNYSDTRENYKFFTKKENLYTLK